MGEQVLTGYLTGKLACRLQIEDCFRRHPEIAEQDVPAPIFGLGLPRTGSTALGVMLGRELPPQLDCHDNTEGDAEAKGALKIPREAVAMSNFGA